MIVLPPKSMTLVGLDPPTNFRLPARPDSMPGLKYYIGGVPTYINFNYARTQIIFVQASFDGTTTTGYMSKPNTGNGAINIITFYKNAFGFLFYGDRTYSALRVSLSPIDGLIDAIQFGERKGLAYCGSGGGTQVGGSLINFMDAANDAVVLSTYTGGVTGGGDTATINGDGFSRLGWNSKFNGYGFAPAYNVILPLYNKGPNGQQACQFDDQHIAVVNGNNIDIWEYSNQISGNGSCIYDIILPKCNKIDSIYIPDLFPGNFTYGYEYGIITSPMDGTFTIAVSGLTYSTVTNRLFHFRYPGPIIWRIDFTNSSGGDRASNRSWFVTSDGYFISIFDNGNLSDLNMWNVKTSDKIDLSITFTTPAKIPPPQSVNTINTIQRKFIDRGF